MKRASQICFILLLTACVGCGGGGGKYFRLATMVNQVGLVKKMLPPLPAGYTQVDLPVTYSKRKDRELIRKEGMKIFGKSRYFCETVFQEKTYYVEADGFVNIRDESGEVIKELRVPRYAGVCAAFSLEFGGNDYLVVYVAQQTTSHSSTLFLLDSNFDIVFQDHLLGAEEVGYGSSQEYGNYIVIKSEDFWFPNGHDVPNPRVNINGDWLYYLPRRKGVRVPALVNPDF